MRLFGKILCPVDFSENSVKALQWTEFLAKKFDSQVVILHVFEMPYPAFASPAFDYDQYKETIQSNLRDYLVPLKIQYESMLSTGDPANKIVALAKGLDATLIVMGTRGLRGAAHRLLGSTAETVVRNSSIAVMTISPQCNSPHDESGRGVLMPVSSLLRPPRGFVRLRKIIREVGTGLYLIHVVDLNDPMFDSSFSANPFLVTTYETTEKKQDLARIATMIMGSEDKVFESIIQFGTVSQEILSEIDSGKYDYVLMGAKKKTFLSGFVESTVYKVISWSMIPVITVKAE